MDANEWVADRIGLVLSGNDSRLYWRLHGAACDGVTQGLGSPAPDRDTYELMLGGRGQLDRAEVADAVGRYVCDEIRDAIAEASLPEPWGTLLIDLLDLDDSVQRHMIGDQWMPDADDVEWPDADEDDDDDTQ